MTKWLPIAADALRESAAAGDVGVAAKASHADAEHVRTTAKQAPHRAAQRAEQRAEHLGAASFART